MSSFAGYDEAVIPCSQIRLLRCSSTVCRVTFSITSPSTTKLLLTYAVVWFGGVASEAWARMIASVSSTDQGSVGSAM
jgi:hypothetical protein